MAFVTEAFSMSFMFDCTTLDYVGWIPFFRLIACSMYYEDPSGFYRGFMYN